MTMCARLVSALLVLAVAGCSGSAALQPRAGVLPAARTASGTSGPPSPIKHVVIVFQENRSFDNIFAGYPGADAPMSGKMSNGQTVALHPIGLVSSDVCHGYYDAVNDYDSGAMDRFDQNCTDRGSAGTFTYSYIRRDESAPYWSMARQYTLADRMFPTMMGPSWTAHLSIVAGTADLTTFKTLVDLPTSSPWGCDAPPGTTTFTLTQQKVYQAYGPYPCFTQIRTLADVLDAGNVSWRYYAPPISYGGLWTAFDAFSKIRNGPDWANVISPSPTVLTDVAGGKLAGVTWVVPDWPYSDHAGGGNQGPSWVSAVVNAIGQSQFWDSTAIVVLWDDWGGWYDDAAPPQLDFRGLGLRVGCIIISPYAKKHYVSHTQYEFGSVLKFVEETFNLPNIGTYREDGYTDGRAASISDSFDFTRPPSAFKKIEAPYPPSTFIRMKPSMKAPDDE